MRLQKPVLNFVQEHPDFTVEKQERFWPHKQDGEGHFVAKLVRRAKLLPDDANQPEHDTGLADEPHGKSRKNKKGKAGSGAISKENTILLEEFFREAVSDDMAEWIQKGKLAMFGEQLYRLPDMRTQAQREADMMAAFSSGF